MTPSFFISSFYLFHFHLFLSSSFENFEHDLPQLEHPKVVEDHNITWCPKVAEANNYTWHPKECFLHISFLFNFLVVNPVKHNDKINFSF